MKGTQHAARLAGNLKGTHLLEDRRLCLVDVAKQQVLRTVQHPQLMALKVFLDECLTTATIVFPDHKSREVLLTPAASLVCDYWGRNVELGLLDSSVNADFSRYLGKEVTLALAPAGSIIFGAPFSLLGTATLNELARQLDAPQLVKQDARFRSTFFLETERAFEEEKWSGQIIRLEGEAFPLHTLEIRVGEPIGRCAVVDSNPISGVRDLKILKHLAHTRPKNTAGEPYLGMYAYALTAA